MIEPIDLRTLAGKLPIAEQAPAPPPLSWRPAAEIDETEALASAMRMTSAELAQACRDARADALKGTDRGTLALLLSLVAARLDQAP